MIIKMKCTQTLMTMADFFLFGSLVLKTFYFVDKYFHYFVL